MTTEISKPGGRQYPAGTGPRQIHPPPQAVRKVGISKQNRHPTMFWKGWNWLMRYFSDRLPRQKPAFYPQNTPFLWMKWPKTALCPQNTPFLWTNRPKPCTQPLANPGHSKPNADQYPAGTQPLANPEMAKKRHPTLAKSRQTQCQPEP